MSDSDNKLPDPELSDSMSSDELSDEDIAKSVLQAWGKPIPRQWKNEDLMFFHPIEHKPEIEALSRGLTMEETLAYYGLVMDALPEYDAVYFVSTFLRGRMKGKADAVTALFKNMHGPQGTQASLAYLNRFAELFNSEDGSNNGSAIKAIKLEIVE
jgi:hypothetical protein